MVTLPMAGTYMDAFSFTSGPKFCQQVSLTARDTANRVDNSKVPHLFRREIDAYSSFSQQVTREFVLMARDTCYHDITKREATF
jgi:hypothetical protein